LLGEVPLVRVSLAGVVKAYGAHTVLDRVDLALGARTRLGLVGPNGAGKSTLLRLLAGVELPDAGRVERTPASLTVGYLPQEHDRRPGETLLGYLARRTGVAAAQVDVERHTQAWDAEAYATALDRFLALGGGDLQHRAQAVCAELGLTVSLEQETATLSGGEAARAGLAAILLSRFDVLLLDEPTNHLDVRAQLSSLDLLRRLAARGHTVLAALHDLGLAAAHADHVVVLQDGRVVASGAPHDVLEPGLIRAVWGVDAEVLEHPVTGRPLIAYSGVAGDRSDQRMPRARPVAAGHPEA
jgi:iron complex transport system ATP-binding protein